MNKVKPVRKSAPATKHTVGKGKKLPAAAQKVLNVAAALSMQKESPTVSREDIATVVAAQCGIKGQSTVANAYTALKNANLIEMIPKEIKITEQGMEQADISELNFKIPKSTQEYLDSMKEIHKLKQKACDLLDELVDGEAHAKKDIADALGMKMNSTFANILTSCKKAGIIRFDAKTIQLAKEMLKYA